MIGGRRKALSKSQLLIIGIIILVALRSLFVFSHSRGGSTSLAKNNREKFESDTDKFQEEVRRRLMKKKSRVEEEPPATTLHTDEDQVEGNKQMKKANSKQHHHHTPEAKEPKNEEDVEETRPPKITRKPKSHHTDKKKHHEDGTDEEVGVKREEAKHGKNPRHQEQKRRATRKALDEDDQGKAEFDAGEEKHRKERHLEHLEGKATIGDKATPKDHNHHKKEAVPVPTPASGPASGKIIEKDYDGMDLETKDHKTRPKPGGSEPEALKERIKLGKHNWPLKPPHQMAWRSGDREEIPEGLLIIQRTVGTGEKSLELDLAMKECKVGNVLEGQWDCLLHKYKKLEPKKCNGVYGAGLIDRFHDNNHVMCSKPKPQDEEDGDDQQPLTHVGQHLKDSSPIGSNSGVHCKSMRVSSEHGIDTAICSANNIAVNFGSILNGDFPWLNFQKGALQLNCNVNKKAKNKNWNFMHCLKDWMDLGFDASTKSDFTEACDEIVEQPTYFVTRSGDYSPFALTHDWLNSVLIYSTEGIKPNDIAVVMMDRMTVGFYTPVWQMLFSPKQELQWYPDMAKAYKGKKICYRKAYFNIPARLSPIYNKDECGSSPLYRLYRDLVLTSVNQLRVAPVRERFIINMIVRRNYQTGHPIGRRFANGPELVKKLRESVTVMNPVTKEELPVVVNEVDYAELDFDQQLGISRSTDLMIAMHGAGLAQIMFQHDHGGVFEFFCPEKPSSNYRYNQLSQHMGLSYDSFELRTDENRIPVDQVMSKLKKLIKTVAKNKLEHFSKSGGGVGTGDGEDAAEE